MMTYLKIIVKTLLYVLLNGIQLQPQYSLMALEQATWS